MKKPSPNGGGLFFEYSEKSEYSEYSENSEYSDYSEASEYSDYRTSIIDSSLMKRRKPLTDV